MNEQQTKDLIQKLGAVRDQCSRKIERLKTQLKCPSNYHNQEASGENQEPGCGRCGTSEGKIVNGLCYGCTMLAQR